MKEKIKIYKIRGNRKNPRVIKDDKFYKLVNSIKEFPEMLEKRPIVVDEDMVVLGGNMRLKACKDAGLKEVWVDIAKGWTQQQKDEFIVKDNVNFGEWDWDILGNEWNTQQLAEWGLDVWQNQDDIYEEELFEEGSNATINNEVTITLKVPRSEYENLFSEITTLIDKFKNVSCNVQN
tara:strand:- start:3511 stop:4044 length:534 start_codon:yes stop_codon:yes gene_type:complete